MVSTRSVAVAPSGILPTSLKPTTSGVSMYTGCPSMTASASMPPTPQPSTPRPLIIVVWLSVPTSESGYTHGVGASDASLLRQPRARYSRFTWWTMPVAGGTARKLSRLSWPHFRKVYRSLLRSNSRSALIVSATRVAKSSTCTEWSMTRSQATAGLIWAGSPPSFRIASRIAAKSTTHGTPVKSCSTTRPGRKGISTDSTAVAS